MITEAESGHLGKEKGELYDRQLRLWGEHGQIALENAKVCVINSGATGSEILKNLVLPGIGGFAILDGNKVAAADLGNNFFLDFASLGHSRGERVKELLCELNKFVDGQHREEDPVKVIEEDIEYFNQFQVVVVTELLESSLLKLAKYLFDNDIALIVCKSNGFIGRMRIVSRTHTIVESKPEDVPDDLRLFEPFDSLVAFAKSFDMEKLDSHLHSHVPYVVILLRAVEHWKSEHNGEPPKTRDEKNEFKARYVERERRCPIEQNFTEAFASAYKAYVPTEVPYEMKEMFEDERTKNITAESTDFWIMTAALKQFVQETNFLPLQGILSDMTADTHSYMELSTLFQKKAKEDQAKVSDYAHQILESIGKPVDSISDDYIKLFCKNARSIRHLQYRSLEQEYNPETANKEAMAMSLFDPDSNLAFYLLQRAGDRFYEVHGAYPGYEDGNVESDAPKLKAIVDELLSALELEGDVVTDDHISELCRFGGSELHNVAALLGGVCAQEVTKLITHQWVPMNNTLIYNGMNSTTTVLEL